MYWVRPYQITKLNVETHKSGRISCIKLKNKEGNTTTLRLANY